MPFFVKAAATRLLTRRGDEYERGQMDEARVEDSSDLRSGKNLGSKYGCLWRRCWQLQDNPSAPASQRHLQVSVAASDPNGNPLSYKWRASDGTIVDVNVASTTWTLPNGPGLHFAYMLVSNGKGGYTERRVAVKTDSFGTSVTIPSPTNLF